jgi:hypothetical protein
MSASTESNSLGVTIVRFGEARVVLNGDHRMHLVGGSARERSEAMEWLGMFLSPNQCATLEEAGAPVPYELWSIATI